MEKKLTELLDNIYELEGLVDLSLRREDNRLDFFRLITKKGIEIYKLCNAINNQIEEISNKEKKEKSGYFLETEKNHNIEINVSDNLYPDEYSLEEELIDNKEKPSRGKLVFSINDKYLYRRELFNDSDIEFNNTLALVASMENYEEAEDYFMNEKEWDFKNPHVATFLVILKNYFR